MMESETEIPDCTFLWKRFGLIQQRVPWDLGYGRVAQVRSETPDYTLCQKFLPAEIYGNRQADRAKRQLLRAIAGKNANRQAAGRTSAGKLRYCFGYMDIGLPSWMWSKIFVLNLFLIISKNICFWTQPKSTKKTLGCGQKYLFLICFWSYKTHLFLNTTKIKKKDFGQKFIYNLKIHLFWTEFWTDDVNGGPMSTYPLFLKSAGRWDGWNGFVPTLDPRFWIARCWDNAVFSQQFAWHRP